jgi:phosphate transport system substrate-binding protein
MMSAKHTDQARAQLRRKKTMRNIAKLPAVALAGVLIVMTCQLANAQTLTQEELRDLRQQIILSIPKEVIQEIKQQLIAEIKKDLVAELKKELVGNGKNQAQDVVKDLLASGNSGGIKAALAAVTGGGNADVNSMLAALGRQLMKTRPNSRAGGLTDESPDDSMPLNGNPVAIVTNTSNPLTALTVEQIQKLYTGEYTNWNQVGGPDLTVKVVVWGDSLGSLESAMKATVTPDTMKLSYLSLIVPAVDRTKGAIGFLPTANMEQLQFVTGHKALKKMAVKTDEEAPAVAPSLQTVKQGAYPVVADKVTAQPGVFVQKAVNVSLNGL